MRTSLLKERSLDDSNEKKDPLLCEESVMSRVTTQSRQGHRSKLAGGSAGHNSAMSRTDCRTPDSP